MQGLNETNPKAAEIEESNAYALAIIPPGRPKLCYLIDIFQNSSDWEIYRRFIICFQVKSGPLVSIN